MDLYEKVKKLAESKGLSIAALEREANIANGTIWKWKDGADRVRFSTIKAIAKVLEVNIEELV